MGCQLKGLNQWISTRISVRVVGQRLRRGLERGPPDEEERQRSKRPAQRRSSSGAAKRPAGGQAIDSSDDISSGEESEGGANSEGPLLRYLQAIAPRGLQLIKAAEIFSFSATLRELAGFEQPDDTGVFQRRLRRWHRGQQAMQCDPSSTSWGLAGCRPPSSNQTSNCAQSA